MPLKNITTEDIKYLIIILQYITAIIGSIYYYKFKKTVLKYFLFLLWYTSINDTIGLLYQSFNNVTSNYFIYNIYQIIRFIVILFIYKIYIESTFSKKIITAFIFIYCLSVVINFFIESFWNDYFLNTFIIGSSCIAISVLLFMFEILRSEKVLYISESLIFWISSAYLIYFVPNIPFYIVRKYYSDSNTIPYIFIVNYFLLLAYYLIHIIGFIWSKPETKE